MDGLQHIGWQQGENRCHDTGVVGPLNGRGEVTEWDARLRVGCWVEGRGGDVGARDVGRGAAGEWREGPGREGSGIWSESIVVGRKKALLLSSPPR